MQLYIINVQLNKSIIKEINFSSFPRQPEWIVCPGKTTNA